MLKTTVKEFWDMQLLGLPQAGMTPSNHESVPFHHVGQVCLGSRSPRAWVRLFMLFLPPWWVQCALLSPFSSTHSVQEMVGSHLAQGPSNLWLGLQRESPAEEWGWQDKQDSKAANKGPVQHSMGALGTGTCLGTRWTVLP